MDKVDVMFASKEKSAMTISNILYDEMMINLHFASQFDAFLRGETVSGDAVDFSPHIAEIRVVAAAS